LNIKDRPRLEALCEIAKDIIPCGHARIVAALYIKNELVSIGWNQSKTSPFAMKYGKHEKAICLHAEQSAIKQALHRFSVEDLSNAKTTLYVARVKRLYQGSNFVWGLAKPCSGCFSSIVDFDIKRIVYTLDNGEYEELP